MNERAGRGAAYEEILALPETLVGEILHGRLYTHPRPAPKHARAYAALTGSLWNPFDQAVPGIGVGEVLAILLDD